MSYKRGPREIIARAIDPERWALIDGMEPSDSALPILMAMELMRADAVIDALSAAGWLSVPGSGKFW